LLLKVSQRPLSAVAILGAHDRSTRGWRPPGLLMMDRAGSQDYCVGGT
jgi:hypothetical protein